MASPEPEAYELPHTFRPLRYAALVEGKQARRERLAAQAAVHPGAADAVVVRADGKRRVMLIDDADPLDEQRQRRRHDAGHLQGSPYARLADFPDRVVLAHSQDVGYRYELYANAPAALRYMLCNPQAELNLRFYMVEDYRKVFAFFDFDKPIVAGTRTDVSHFIEACRLAVLMFCAFVDGALMWNTARVYDARWHFYEACTPAKLSAHAHSALVFADVVELGRWVARFVALLDEMRRAGYAHVAPLFYWHAKQERWRCIIDPAVYTPRPFRLPYNRKDSSAANPLRPWPRPAPGAVMSLAEHAAHFGRHLTTGFVHPNALAHGAAAANEPVPRYTGGLRAALTAFLLRGTAWPLPSLAALHRHISAAWQLALNCRLGEAELCAAQAAARSRKDSAPRQPGSPVALALEEQALGDDDALRAAVVDTFIGSSPAAALPASSQAQHPRRPSEVASRAEERRIQWLQAVAALQSTVVGSLHLPGSGNTAALSAAIGPGSLLAQTRASVLQSSYGLSVAPANGDSSSGAGAERYLWRERLVSLAAQCGMAATPTDSRAAPRALPCNLLAEYAFGALHLRTLVYLHNRAMHPADDAAIADSLMRAVLQLGNGGGGSDESADDDDTATLDTAVAFADTDYWRFLGLSPAHFGFPAEHTPLAAISALSDGFGMDDGDDDGGDSGSGGDGGSGRGNVDSDGRGGGAGHKQRGAQHGTTASRDMTGPAADRDSNPAGLHLRRVDSARGLGLADLLGRLAFYSVRC